MMRAILRELGQDPEDLNPDDLDEIDRLFFDHEDTTSGAARRSGDAPIVALVCPKGGTGKTSIAVMLAGALSTRRRRVGVLDLDPRGGIEKWSKAGAGLPFPTYSCSVEKGPEAFQRTLRRSRSEVDLVIVDTPPRVDEASRMALAVADLALIPAGASALDLNAVQETLEVAEAARSQRDGKRPRVKVVPSRQDARTRLAKEFGSRVKALRVPVTPAVGQRVEVAAAADSGRLVRPGTTAGREFQKLSRHVLSSLRTLNG